jgi:hypothetical protein
MANAVACGNIGGGTHYSRGGHQGHHVGNSHPNGVGGRSGNPNNPYKNHQCDICEKLGHSVLHCWKRFDKHYTGPEKSAHTTTISYDLDPSWYVDSAATDHITGILTS